ncbi:MAG: glycosyltransferase, partial [Planctomycetota bacterium]
MTSTRISVVLPVYNENLNIEACLRGLWRALEPHEHEILVCYDFDEDKTLPVIAAMADRPPSVRLVKNQFGRGAANALRAGFQAATGDVIVTTMADLSDPPELIPAMAEKIRSEKAAVVSGSRYVKGGSQTGGPLFKRICSQTASLTLKWISGLSTHDATSNFRAYSRDFIEGVRIESKQGFEIALELTVKAHLQGRKVAEVPSSWTDRSAGESRFQLWKWAPNYLRWYWEAMAAPVFVWIAFGAMLAAAFTFVARYSSSMPLWDDLEWSPYVDSSVTPSATWWWSNFNEHRIPLPRAFFLALVRTFHDIRSGMYFDVGLLGAVAFAMILLARKLRGRTSYSDAFFPLLWLTWGNCDNLLMMHQISLIVPSAITCALLIMFTATPEPPSWKRSLAIGLCLFSLPLCGAPGLTPAPAIILWLCYAGWRLIRSDAPGARTSGRVLLAFALATVALIGFYFYGFVNPGRAVYAKSSLEAVRQAWMFVSLGFGPGAREYWPFSGWLTGAIMLAGAWILLLALRKRPAERYRAAGLMAIAAGIFAMALS